MRTSYECVLRYHDNVPSRNPTHAVILLIVVIALDVVLQLADDGLAVDPLLAVRRLAKLLLNRAVLAHLASDQNKLYGKDMESEIPMGKILSGHHQAYQLSKLCYIFFISSFVHFVICSFRESHEIFGESNQMQISKDSQQVSPAPSYRNARDMPQKDELFFLTSNMSNAGTYPN